MELGQALRPHKYPPRSHPPLRRKGKSAGRSLGPADLHAVTEGGQVRRHLQVNEHQEQEGHRTAGQGASSQEGHRKPLGLGLSLIWEAPPEGTLAKELRSAYENFSLFPLERNAGNFPTRWEAVKATFTGVQTMRCREMEGGVPVCAWSVVQFSELLSLAL